MVQEIDSKKVSFTHLGTLSRTKLSVFFNIVQTAFDPPPSFLNIYVADYIAK